MPKPDALDNRQCCYREYYAHQAMTGGGGDYYAGFPNQKGHGIGSLFSGLMRFVRPLLMRGAKFLGKKAVSTGTKIFSDVVSGDNVGQSAKRRINETLTDIRDQHGSGKRRKKGLKRAGKKQSSKKRIKSTIQKRIKSVHRRLPTRGPRDIFS